MSEKYIMRNKDLDMSLLQYLDDKSLLNMINLNKNYLEKVQELAEKRIRDKYPTLVKWKPDNQTWFYYYLSLIYYLALLKEKFGLEFVPFLFKDETPKSIYEDLMDERKSVIKEKIGYYRIEHFLFQNKFNEAIEILKTLKRIGWVEVFFTVPLNMGNWELYDKFFNFSKDSLKDLIKENNREYLLSKVNEYKEMRGRHEFADNFIKATIASNDKYTLDLILKQLITNKRDRSFKYHLIRTAGALKVPDMIPIIKEFYESPNF